MINIRNTLIFTSICLIVFTSGSLLLKIEPMAFLSKIISLIVIFFNILNIKKTKINNVVYFIGCLFLALLLSFCVNLDFKALNNYLGLMLNIILAYSIFLVGDAEVVKKYYLKLMMVISVLSLVGYYFSDFFSFLRSNFYFRDQLYYYYWFYGYVEGVEYRNFSIFIEPGLFQVFVSFSILIMILDDGRSYYKYGILFLTLFTTNSTAGLLMGFMLLAFLLNKKISNFYIKLYVFPLVVIFLFYLASFLGVLENIDNKFNGAESRSSIERMLSASIDFEIFKDNPISGVGFGNYINSIENRGYYIDAATNTYTQILAILGLSYFSILLLIIYMSIKKFNFETVLMLMSFFIVSYYFQPFLQYPFFYFSILFFFFYKEKYNLNNKYS